MRAIGKDRIMDKYYASAGAIALAALLGWASYAVFAPHSGDPFATCRTGVVAGGQIGGAFSLTDQNGQTVTDAQLFAKPALVYFGYTSCRDVCPLDNARNAEAAAILVKQGYDLTPVFITLDPARDTPAALKEYLANFSARLVGLTGTPGQIKAAAAAFKVYYGLPDNPGKDYEVEHTTLTYLMLPKLGFADFFQRETTAQQMADRTDCFLQAS